MRTIKLILFLAFFLIIIQGASAMTSYKQLTEVNLKIPFSVNGSIPTANAQCNISLEYPNSSSVRIPNVTLTNMGDGLFNLSLIDLESKELGVYSWVAFCCDINTKCAAGAGSYEITPSGADAINSGEGMVLFLGLLSIMIMGILFFISGLKVNNLAARIILFGLASILFLIVTLFTLVIFTEVLGLYSNLVEGYGYFWMVLKTIIGIAILALLLFAGLLAWNLWSYKRGFID